MKNLIFSFLFLATVNIVAGQTATEHSSADQQTEQLTAKYQLDEEQQTKMLEIQTRKYRNLAQIEEFKMKDPQRYIEKIRALQYANESSLKNLLNENQLAIFRQEQIDLRKKKAEVYQQLKGSGASQFEIDKKISELEEEALLNG